MMFQAGGCRLRLQFFCEKLVPIAHSFVSLLCIYYLHTRFVNSIWFCAAAMAVQGLLDYVFYFVIWRYDGAGSVIYLRILPCLVLTVLITPLVFWIVRKIAFLFHHAPRA